MSDTETKTKKPDKPVVPSKEFRTVYINAFRMRLKDNDVMLSLATEVDDSQGNEYLQDEVRVVMTPRTAKILMLSLNKVMKVYEESIGVIQLPPSKEEEIAKATVKVATKKSSES